MIATWEAALDEFCEALDRGESTLLDDYAAEGPQEFFAVAVEAFFVNPVPFAQHHPALYASLRDYFRQDPAQAPDKGRPQAPF